MKLIYPHPSINPYTIVTPTKQHHNYKVSNENVVKY